MARKKLKWHVSGDMFGQDVYLVWPDKDAVTVDGERIDRVQVGQGIAYDPLSRFDAKLKTGYLFRSPKTNPIDLATVWDTLEQFSGSYRLWSEFEKKDDKIEITTFALIADQSEATMFAFAHSSFEKWSDEKETADKAERRRKPTKLRVTKDGRIKGTITVETLGD